MLYTERIHHSSDYFTADWFPQVLTSVMSWSMASTSVVEQGWETFLTQMNSVAFEHLKLNRGLCYICMDRGHAWPVWMTISNFIC